MPIATMSGPFPPPQHRASPPEAMPDEHRMLPEPSTSTVPGETTTADDVPLIARARQGDHAAFTTLMQRYLPATQRIARQLLTQPTDAEDAVQEAWLRVYAALPRFQGRSPLVHWVAAITANTCRDWQRRAGRRRAHEREAGQASLSGSRTTAAAEDPRLPLVRAALARLPAEVRAALLLHHVEGLDYATVAAALQLREGTARMRVKRGLDRVRVELERYGIAQGALLALAPAPALTATLVRRIGALTQGTGMTASTAGAASGVSGAAAITAAKAAGTVLLLGSTALLATHLLPRLPPTHRTAVAAVAPQLPPTASTTTPALSTTGFTPPVAPRMDDEPPGPVAGPPHVVTVEGPVWSLQRELENVAHWRLDARSGSVEVHPAHQGRFFIAFDVGPFVPEKPWLATGVSIRWKPVTATDTYLTIHVDLLPYLGYARYTDRQHHPLRVICVQDGVEMRTHLTAAGRIGGRILYHWLGTPQHPPAWRIVQWHADNEKRWIGGITWMDMLFDHADLRDDPLVNLTLEGIWAPAP